MTSILFVKRTFATLRSAELGFLGVVVYTRVQTPRRCGQESSALDLLFARIISLPFLTNCCIVGIRTCLNFRTAKVTASPGISKLMLFSNFYQPAMGIRPFTLPDFSQDFFNLRSRLKCGNIEMHAIILISEFFQW